MVGINIVQQRNIARESKPKKDKGGDMESPIGSSCDYQLNFFKPETVFLKDNVRIISYPYYHLGCSCVLLSYPAEGD